MAINFSALTTTTPLNVSTANITDINNMVPNMINQANSGSEGYFGLVVMLLAFMIIFFYSFKQDGDIRSDLSRSLMISSGFSSILGLIMLVTGFSSSFSHLMYFLTIFIISIVAIFNLKRKGL